VSVATTVEFLPPDAAARLADFARTCKAAARAVSLYPAGHPAIDATLARLAQASGVLAENGPFRIQVHADELLTDGARMPRFDPGVSELAALLHRHLIGALTVNAGADADSWRTLLLLLARSPEDIRADGGIAHLWSKAGGPSLEIQEIDYAEVLRDKQHGVAATIEMIVAAAVAGPRLDLDETGMAALLDILADPAKLEQLIRELERSAATAPQGGGVQTTAFLNLLRGVVDYVTRTEPQQLTTVLEQFGRGTRHLSVEAMLSLLAERPRPEAVAGGINVVNALIEHMSDSSVASFVAHSVVAERGASERLAHAFQALVPELDRQRQLLPLAREEVAQSPLGRDEADFPELWQRVEHMLTSYSDAQFVSEEYARELTYARTQPVDIERTADDPPERVTAWLGTVADAALRRLDRDLLVDLLTIETDASRWRDIAETVVTHADDLVRVGYFEEAWHLVRALIEKSGADAQRQQHATGALERFGRGSLMKHVAPHLRSADDAAYEEFTRVCHAIGPSLVPPLAEALAAEQDARSRRRLRDTLIGFGPRGAEAVRQLMNAPNWEVRRTAGFLLREFGGAEGLKELVPLLTDTEPLVQREAVQGLLLSGSPEASAILLSALLGATGRTRHTLLAEVLSMRDERAALFLGHVLRHLEPRTLPVLYAAAIDALGSSTGPDAVDALRLALYRGHWWTPLANRRFRTAAAQSLRKIGTPDALAALRDASARGAFGVRAAARAELGRVP
jgi:hypothetical protein